MSKIRWLNIAARGLVVLTVAVFATLLVSCSGKQPQMSENTPTPSPVEPSATPTEAPTPTVAPTETPAEKVKIVWFVGLGTGTEAGQLEPQEEFVEQFNASQDHIELELQLANIYFNGTSGDELATQIATRQAPDIVGPVGIAGRDRFKGEWLDLAPLIEANQYDLSDFDPAAVNMLHVEGEGQLSIPFAIYPSFIFVNKNLFAAAGLPYPPQQFGAPYVDENGNPHEWNMDTLRDLAMRLTLDRNGNNATSPAFDPQNIVQFGFLSQFTDMRGALTMFGSGNLIGDDGNAQMPEQWREGAHWIYDAMWKDHFWPTDVYLRLIDENYGDISLLGDNPFQSGHLAMAQVHMWYAAQWALGDIDFAWDTAVMPSYHGVTTARMHTDNFYILKDSKHPQEAFEVLSYMLRREHAAQLLVIYGGMPARLSLQDAYFDLYGARWFPGQEINWQVVIDSTSYADIPNHESWLPDNDRGQYNNDSIIKYGDYWERWSQEPNLDLDAEIDALLVDLQSIFDRSN